MNEISDFFKKKRIEQKKTLRQFCLEHDLDPGNISKIERGKMSPPSSEEKLKEYAKYLNIEYGSKEWQAFKDLAAISAGKIPEDLKKEEEVLKRLPIFFRALREKKLTEKEFKELIDKIKNS